MDTVNDWPENEMDILKRKSFKFCLKIKKSSSDPSNMSISGLKTCATVF